MTPITTNLPVASMTCPGCDCRLCAAGAAQSIEQIEGVHHVRVDRFRGAFVVRHDPTVDVEAMSSRVVEAGLRPG
jgi:copper chaperone CopZ